MRNPNNERAITATKKDTLSELCKRPKFVLKERLVELPIPIIESLSRLEDYEIPQGIVDKIRTKRPFSKMSAGEIDECILEFKKFIGLLVINQNKNRRIDMVSEVIDEVWHTFILFTKEYEVFSLKIMNGFIHHKPITTANVECRDVTKNFPQFNGTHLFYQDYSRYYGCLSYVWEIQEKPMSEREYKKYLKQKACILPVYAILAVIGPTLLVQEFFKDMLLATIGTILYGVSIIVLSIFLYQKAGDNSIKKLIRQGSFLLGDTVLIIGFIFLFYCQTDYMIVLFPPLFFMTAVLISEVRPSIFRSSKGKAGGSGCGVGAAACSGGGGCGGGGCGGGCGC